MKNLNKFSKCIISLLLCVITALNVILIKPYSAKIDRENAEYSAIANTTGITEIPETNYVVSVYDSSLIDEQQKHDSILSGVQSSVTNELTEEEMIEFQILKVIYEDVAYEINLQDYDVFESSILDLDNNVFWLGLTYTQYESVNDVYKIGDCIKITNDNTKLNENGNYVSFNSGEDDGYRYLISSLNIEKNNDHFIYYDKYVKYYWTNSRTIHYDILDNVSSNYDLSYGALFSYDDCKYVTDNDFIYTSIEVQSMFSSVDYDKLQTTIDSINAEQNKNGYYVSEITITIIDYELIAEWERLSDKDSFYGYDLDSLNEVFGTDTTLEFNANGEIKKAELIETKTTNWLKVGLMIGAGVAAMLIGAALAPLTGGCSFGAALLCIVKMTAVSLITDIIVQTAISTISGVISGQSFGDALSNAAKNTLAPENLAKAFMMSAIMSAVMVGSGLVKACFVEGTQVLTENGYASIETIAVGDKVISYDEATGIIQTVAVTEVMKNMTDDICTIALDSGDTVTSTSLHPWYTKNRGWVAAYALETSDEVLTEDGNEVKILGVHRQKLAEPIEVFNLTVGETEDESFHTYFVGEDGLLVHNACTSKVDKTTKTQNSKPSAKEIKNARQNAVRKAWKNEQQAVIKGTSKYPWTQKQTEEILKYGKVKGFQGCHLMDVSKNLNNLELIGNPDNIVFLQRAQHLFIHDGSWLNPTNLKKVKELLPWVVEQLTKLGL